MQCTILSVAITNNRRIYNSTGPVRKTSNPNTKCIKYNFSLKPASYNVITFLKFFLLDGKEFINKLYDIYRIIYCQKAYMVFKIPGKQN